jgi:uncharacterized glyoxalase superfamily protein PhnB
MAVEKDWILHASFDEGVTLMASDRGKDAPAPATDGMIQLTLNCDNVMEEEKLFNALSEGGKEPCPW